MPTSLGRACHEGRLGESGERFVRRRMGTIPGIDDVGADNHGGPGGHRHDLCPYAEEAGLGVCPLRREVAGAKAPKPDEPPGIGKQEETSEEDAVDQAPRFPRRKAHAVIIRQYRQPISEDVPFLGSWESRSRPESRATISREVFFFRSCASTCFIMPPREKSMVW